MEGAFQQKTKKQTPNKLKREQKRSITKVLLPSTTTKEKRQQKKEGMEKKNCLQQHTKTN